MKFVSFSIDGDLRYGLVKNEGVIDLSMRVGGDYPDLRAFIASEQWRQISSRLLETESTDYAYDGLSLRSVIPNASKILCVALNYRDHIAEANRSLPGGREVTKHPTMFARFPASLVGHREAIVRPHASHQLDYEAELLVVIGRRTPRRVPREKALEYVFGYAAMNEGSVRDYQFHTRQLTPGKNFEASGATGPWLVTADEVGDPQSLDVKFRLNGQVLQEANTSDMIFPVADLIAYVSEWLPLEPGDMIASGTMGGVGFTRTPPVFMKPGDLAEVSIGKVGTLLNTVRDEGDIV